MMKYNIKKETRLLHGTWIPTRRQLVRVALDRVEPPRLRSTLGDEQHQMKASISVYCLLTILRPPIVVTYVETTIMRKP